MQLAVVTEERKGLRYVVELVEAEVKELERQLEAKRSVLNVLLMASHATSQGKRVLWEEFLEFVLSRDEFLHGKLTQVTVIRFTRDRLEFSAAPSVMSFLQMYRGKLRDLCEQYTGEKTVVKLAKGER